MQRKRRKKSAEKKWLDVRHATALLCHTPEEQRHQIAGNELIMKQSGVYCFSGAGKNDLMSHEIGS